MKKVQLSVELVQGIANYLGTCTYTQVAPLIAALQRELQGQEEEKKLNLESKKEEKK